MHHVLADQQRQQVIALEILARDRVEERRAVLEAEVQRAARADEWTVADAIGLVLEWQDDRAVERGAFQHLDEAVFVVVGTFRRGHRVDRLAAWAEAPVQVLKVHLVRLEPEHVHGHAEVPYVAVKLARTFPVTPDSLGSVRCAVKSCIVASRRQARRRWPRPGRIAEISS